MLRKLHVSLAAGTAALIGLVAQNAPVQAAANVTVSASVVAECILATNPLNFGTYVSGQSTAKIAQTNVSYNCPSGLNITLTLNGGLTGTEAGRLMHSATTGGDLQYQLFKEAARTNVWGSGASGVVVSPTPGGGAVTQTIFGRIAQGQGIAAATNYTDTVVYDLVVN